MEPYDLLPEHDTGLALLDPAQVKVDALAYQFRKDGDARGVTKDDRYNVQRWDPVIHGDPILVHQRMDGTYYVADGHHRLNLAQRLQEQGKGPDRIAAMVLKESDGYSVEDAKMVAAYKNMNSGHADIIESARVFKESKKLQSAGKVHSWLLPQLSMDKTNLRMAYALSNLSDNALTRVEMGDVPIAAAALVATQVVDPTKQDALMSEITYQLHQQPAAEPLLMPQQHVILHNIQINHKPSMASHIMAQRFSAAAQSQAISL